eukprot:TRINITY_DN6846_c0_g1_i1.p1 TRINITY_DN6846_c0_g1~~TRINITY_DN6846_c0_g1_i1.p1  ORF type:complete len:433 (+),score=98.78 TRINITY_DN6846_c0_g1_i1:44-1342(+)
MDADETASSDEDTSHTISPKAHEKDEQTGENPSTNITPVTKEIIRNSEEINADEGAMDECSQEDEQVETEDEAEVDEEDLLEDLKQAGLDEDFEDCVHIPHSDERSIQDLRAAALTPESHSTSEDRNPSQQNQISQPKIYTSQQQQKLHNILKETCSSNDGYQQIEKKELKRRLDESPIHHEQHIVSSSKVDVLAIKSLDQADSANRESLVDSESKQQIIRERQILLQRIIELERELGINHPTRVSAPRITLPDVDEDDVEVFEAPPHCIPIRADIRKFDWKMLSDKMKFDVIVMDPPWQLAGAHPTRGVAIAYSQLPNQDIEDMPIPSLQTDGFIFIWVINSRYAYAVNLMRKWGYHMVDDIVWVKRTVNRKLAKGHGFYLQHAKENCLVGKKVNTSNSTSCLIQKIANPRYKLASVVIPKVRFILCGLIS